MQNLSSSETEWLKEAQEKILHKMNLVSQRSADKLPYTTINGVHDDRSDPSKNWSMDNGINWWTNGFFAGIMWQMYAVTNDDKYIEIARKSEQKLDQCFDIYYGLNHDVGFMWLPTAVVDYRITGNEGSKRRGLHAANILAGRFNPAGHFIRAWNDFNDGRDTRGWAIIDCLMNLPLLYWADEQIGDNRYRNVAQEHADMAVEHFIRSDGSVKHIIEFDPKTGRYIKSYAGQGYSHGSSWTRGQAWAIYGLSLSYRHTKKQSYLNTAQKVAEYFIKSIPDNYVIPIDFRQPAEPNYEDSTAAAIAACGLLELVSHIEEKEKAEKFKQTAFKLIHVLYEQKCDFSDQTDGILMKCSASYDETKHEYNIIYGDYYLIEAIFRMNGKWANIW